MKILFDADGLLYIAGFAVEKTHYQAVFDVEGELFVEDFSKAADIKEYLQEHEGAILLDRSSRKEVGPLSHALMVAKSKMTQVQAEFPGIPMEVYIRGDNQKNFRDDLATIVPYKGNRTSEKPVYFEEIRQYLISEWAAYRVEDQEVDDEIGCRLTELNDEAIIVSPDKDLDQFPGQHYNYKKNVHYDVDQAEVMDFFWQQALSGDNADNIKGCWKVGEVAARDIVSGWYDLGLTQEQCWVEVVETYEASKAKPKCPYLERNAEAVALENAQLVWMRRNRGEIWMPPGQEFLQEKTEVALDN